MGLANKYRGKLAFWPALLLALAIVLFVLTSIHFLSRQLRQAREQELLTQAQKTASALKAQLFERYADSQAFSLHPTLEEALRDRSQASIKEASVILNELLDLYQVYRASVLTDRDGRLVVAALSGPMKDNFEKPAQWEGFIGENAKSWIQNVETPRTQVSEMLQRADWLGPFSAEPLQMFSSPVIGPSGEVLGVITNYTSGLYLEREMNLAFEDFGRLGLPPMTITLLDAAGGTIARYQKGQARYKPTEAENFALSGPSGLRINGERILAWQSIADPRVREAVNWSVVLETNESAFFAGVSRLKWGSYAVSFVVLSILLYASFVVHQMQLHHDRTLAMKLHEAQEAERARISREIHDDLGQNLTAIKIQLSRTQNADSAVLLRRIEDAKVMIEETNHVIRRISRELHPSLLENLGLEESLRWKLQQLEDLLNVTWTLVIPPELEIERLPQAAKIHVFRIIQESLNNIQKHARCTEVKVEFKRKGKELCFTVRDNGVGISGDRPKDSMGLKSIEERVKLMGGYFKIESRPGRGTNVVCRVPYGPKTKEGEGYGA